MPLLSFNDLPPRSIEWLWPGRLALGKLSLLDGDPGLGKSLLALDLAARLTTGRPFPDGSPGPAASAVLIFNAEDSPHDTIAPRLRALGADPARVFTHTPDADLDRPLAIPSRLDTLDCALADSDARLLIIDPVIAFLDPAIHAGHDQAVRRALGPLADRAARHRCAVLLLRHLNKSTHARSLYRGGGSIGFQGACRSSWLLAADPAHPRRRVFAEIKNNLGPPQPSLALELPEPAVGVPPLAWLGPSDLTADQVLAHRFPNATPAPRDRAAAFLTDILAAGSKPATELFDAAREAGIAPRTLQRVKRELGVQHLRIVLDGRRQTYWHLPGSPGLPDHIPNSAIQLDPDEILGPKREGMRDEG